MTAKTSLGWVSSFSTVLALTLASTSCSPKVDLPQKPVVLDVKTEILREDKPSAQPPAPVVAAAAEVLKTQSIRVTLTLDKSQILDREFMYNLDLQYSSQYDKGMDLYTQSQVVANLPVRFRIAGSELQLVSDSKLNFPSDVNHPERLISRFEILNETESTLTVSGMNSAAYLATQFGPVDGTQVITYLNHWIRSFHFDANGNYLLQETSIELGDGKTRGEFMEAVYPRENLATGSDFQKIEMNPEDAVGGDEGIVARFRLLPGDAIFQGEKKLAYAQHYDISLKNDGTPGTIDWYVTRNAPDKMLPHIQQGVEAWNRYFTKLDGIQRPVMRFMGKLPEGVQIGDPRYNVINWDSRLVAGAAYETQASDPETGKQSHSLIYLPAAWMKIGADYWKKGAASDETSPADAVANLVDAPREKIGLNARVQCSRDLREGPMLMASGRLLDQEVEKFGIQLLKQTLFHEVGHALGLAHNFKGSLSFDRSKPDSMFSTSIMDYNDYELERRAFDSVDSDQGPQLEYDRQALSALYDGARDVADSDPVLPACNDAEADNEAGGVDPLCIRYDLEKDPTLSVTTAIQRAEEAKLDHDVTLAQALSRIPDLILADSKVSAVQSKDDLVLLAAQFATTLKGSLNFYLVSSEMALGRTVRTNVKALLEYGVDLPEGYEAALMRERVFTGILKVLNMGDIPANAKSSLNDALVVGMTRLAATPFMQSLKEDERAKLVDALTNALVATVATFNTDTAAGLPFMRAKLLLSLARHKSVDFYLGPAAQDSSVDFEKGIVGVLGDVVTSKGRTALERVAAAQALATYKGRLAGNDALAVVKPALLQERVLASTNAQRRAIEAILVALGLNQ